METAAWKEKTIVALLILLLFAAAAGITQAVDRLKGGGSTTCTYRTGDGTEYRSPCPEQLPSGDDGP